jgi:hypothetical protein
MAYNESTAERIRSFLNSKNVDFTEKKMFSGICFFVDEKMLCGTHIDKKTGEELLLCRIGEEKYNESLERNDCIPMNFTGRPMKGYVFAIQEGFAKENGLYFWLQLCLDYNPFSKKSKK